MTNVINLKSVLIAVAIFTTANAVVFYVAPQLTHSTPVAEACCGTDGGGSDTGNDSGDHGDGGGSGGSTYQQPAVCNYFRADKSSVPAGGGNVTFSWSTSNANQGVVISDGVGSVPASGSKTVFVSYTNTYQLTAKGAGGNDACYTKITVEQPKLAGHCDYFEASTNTVPYGGGNVTLAWKTTNADKVFISDGVGYVSGSATKTVFVNGTVTFSLDAIGAGGTDTCQTRVTVESPKTATCDAFTASPSSLPNGGGNVTLNWNTTNATSVYINGIGSVSADGSKTVYVGSTKTFTLTANGTTGSDSCTAKVTVDSVQVTPSCDYFKSSDYSVQDGDHVTLSWGTTNADSVFINNGIGSVSADGSTSVKIYSDITYTLTAKKDGQTDTCAVTINTHDTPDVTPRCDYFDVDDSSVEEGDEVTLSWGTTNADEVYISDGVGHVSNDGSEDVRVYDDTTFELTASNNGREDTCTVHVNVDNNNDEPTPRCDLEVSDDRVQSGDRVTLSWDTSHADDIQIEDDHGNTIFDTDDYSSSKRSRYYDGEIDVRVYDDTEFTLTARGDGGRRTCDVDVRVDDNNIAVYTKRSQPLVAGIALTQVPYTGFEAGPVLTSIFYILLTAWALFMAYLLVIRRSSIFGFRLASPAASVAATEEEDDFKKKVKALAAKHSHQSWNLRM